MIRKHRVRAFKPYLMRYLHGNDPNYEPVLRDILDHEHEVYDELTNDTADMRRGERGERTWEVVFEELTDILSPFQIQQLFDRLSKDVQDTCDRMHEMAEAQRLISRDVGGEG